MVLSDISQVAFRLIMQMSTAMDTESGMIVKRVSVPVGLEELMSGLTKEVLLKKPKDLYIFAAEYFSQLLTMRQKGGYKSNLNFELEVE